MFNRTTYVNYRNLIDNRLPMLKYLIDNSDFFSVIVTIKKPYSQYPPVFNYDMDLRPFVIKYILEKQDWLEDFFGREKHQIMVIYRCCKESRNRLLQMPNIFLAGENDMPENICFYRNNKLWFGTVSHENIAFLVNGSPNEIAFLTQDNTGDGSLR